jgi:hypothetical protein
MKNLWVFGDSYAIPYQNDLESRVHWQFPLMKNLNCDGVKTFAQFGAPNEWIYNQFTEQLNEITPNDFVIFVSTQINRRWFFPDNVGSSNFGVKHIDLADLSSEQQTALNYYKIYLDNPIMSSINFECLCNSIHYVSEKNKINLLILPGFEQKGYPISGRYQVSGSLFDICKNEVKGKDLDSWSNFISNIHKGCDPRVGHLSKDNHQILADKLSATFLKNKILNLEQGFREEFL